MILTWTWVEDQLQPQLNYARAIRKLSPGCNLSDRFVLRNAVVSTEPINSPTATNGCLGIVRKFLMQEPESEKGGFPFCLTDRRALLEEIAHKLAAEFRKRLQKPRGGEGISGNNYAG